MIKEMTKEEWQQLGEQVKEIRKELFVLHGLSTNLPNDIVKHIVKAIDSLDSYRCKAEDRMLDTKVTDDLNIFYGK